MFKIKLLIYGPLLFFAAVNFYSELLWSQGGGAAASADDVEVVSGTATPLYCFFDAQNTESGNQIKQGKCTSYETEGLRNDKNYTFQNVCMYTENRWQRGTLKLTRPTGSGETHTKTFEGKVDCVYGIEVIETQGATVTSFGPTKIGAYNACLDGGSSTSACGRTRSADYYWAGESAPTIAAGNVLVSCFRDEGGAGVQRRSDSCSPYASDEGYCDLVDITESNTLVKAIFDANYRGRWFIRYSKSGKRDPKICAGGVLFSNASEAAEQYGEGFQKVFNQSVSGSTNIFFTTAPAGGAAVTPLSAIVDGPTGESLALTDSSNPSVIGCYYSENNKTKYKVCAQVGGCKKFQEDGTTKEDCSTKQPNYLWEYNLGDCFFHRPANNSVSVEKWHIVTKAKEGKGTESAVCNFIDVTNSARFEPDTRNAPQAHPNIDTAASNLAEEGTLQIGWNSADATKRVIQLGSANNIEVLGLGIDPLVGNICPASTASGATGRDCTKFKIAGLQAEQSPTALDFEDQGLMYVNGGSKFAGNAHFLRDAIVGGNMEIGTADANPPNIFKVNAIFNLTKDMTIGTSTSGASLTVYGDMSALRSGVVDSNLKVEGSGTIEKGLTLGTSSTAATTNSLSVNGSISSTGVMSLGTAISNTSSTSLTVNGGITATGVILSTYTASSSDRRLKTNIHPISNALEKILKLDGVYYQFDSKKFPERHLATDPRVGLVAQNVQAVFPETVLKDKDGFLSIAYGDLVAPLIESVKALHAKIISQDKKDESRFKELEGKLDQLVIENKKLQEKINILEKTKGR